MFLEMLLDAGISSGMPEERKITLRIMQAVHTVEETVRGFMVHFSDPTILPDTPETFKARQDALEYITLVGVGLDQYMQQVKQTNGQTENY